MSRRRAPRPRRIRAHRWRRGAADRGRHRTPQRSPAAPCSDRPPRRVRIVSGAARRGPPRAGAPRGGAPVSGPPRRRSRGRPRAPGSIGLRVGDEADERGPRAAPSRAARTRAVRRRRRQHIEPRRIDEPRECRADAVQHRIAAGEDGGRADRRVIRGDRGGQRLDPRHHRAGPHGSRRAATIPRGRNASWRGAPITRSAPRRASRAREPRPVQPFLADPDDREPAHGAASTERARPMRARRRARRCAPALGP